MMKTATADSKPSQTQHSLVMGKACRLKLSGLQSPMSILNGTALHIPDGALREDININFRLSGFTDWVKDSTARYTHGVLAALKLDVTVGDAVVCPYFFDQPIRLSLPYNQHMLKSLGVGPEDLWMFYYSDSTGFEDSGMTNIVVDTENKRVSADILHFSEIVVSFKNRPAAAVIRNRSRFPRAQNLNVIGNYPNPFNPETQIRFEYDGGKPQWVRVVIYNLIGRKIRSLYNGYVENGIHSMNWDTMDDRGRAAGSGVYIVRIEGPFTAQAHKMLLLR